MNDKRGKRRNAFRSPMEETRSPLPRFLQHAIKYDKSRKKYRHAALSKTFPTVPHSHRVDLCDSTENTKCVLKHLHPPTHFLSRQAFCPFGFLFRPQKPPIKGNPGAQCPEVRNRYRLATSQVLFPKFGQFLRVYFPELECCLSMQTRQFGA